MPVILLRRHSLNWTGETPTSSSKYTSKTYEKNKKKPEEFLQGAEGFATQRNEVLNSFLLLFQKHFFPNLY